MSGAGVPAVLISTVSLSVSVQLYSEMVVILAITAIAAASTATLAFCGLCCPSTKRQVTQEPMRKMLVVNIADTELTGVSYSSNLTVERLRQEYFHGPHSVLEFNLGYRAGLSQRK